MPIQRVTGHILDKKYTDEKAFQLGAIAEDDAGSVYEFVKYKKLGSSEGVAGLFGVSCDSAYNHGEVTSDSDDGDAVVAIPRGQFQAQLDDEELGWVQKRGWNRKAITTDGGVAQGANLVVDTAVRGIVITQAAYVTSVGAAAVADTGTTLAAGSVYLHIA